MWTFIVGLLLGVAVKAVYDLFREEQLPVSVGLSSGRIEALLDETRQSLRELREEVRKFATSEGSVQEKASRVLSTAGEAVRGGKASAGTASDQRADAG